MNLGASWTSPLVEQINIRHRLEAGTAGPEHFGYLLKAVVADTDEKRRRWTALHVTEANRMKGPKEHNDPPATVS